MGTKLLCFDLICICKTIRFSQTFERQTKIYFQTNSKIEGEAIQKNDFVS